MLAKMWKKVLLAICIIACIYNVMSKLVNRGSLEANLHRANDGNTVFDFSSKKSLEEEEEIVDSAVSNSTTSARNTIPMSTNKVEDQAVESEESEETVTNETEEQEQEEKSSIVNFKDFIFNW